ncbi:hypothetical protein G9C85_11970 [Halorubellus sp. JP-L1]|uniref:type IV pilin n=1 Tax=Halorubellus sp. JP-L1 TaxID=2715753 RepID=UPI001408325E|nr:type IV pilin [Halorubellus sp. JP-L1]NHN42338.1 hypothetical protein [Halorubellus sp. JP-L1]
MVGVRAGGTNALHALAMTVLVVVTAFVVGFVVFDLEGAVVPTERQPDAAFEFAYDADAERLAVTHQGGSTLDAERVVLANRAFEEVGRWPAGDAITAGDATTIEGVAADDTVYVAWRTDDGTYVVLASWNDGAPDASPASSILRRVDAPPVDSAANARTATFLPRIE